MDKGLKEIASRKITYRTFRFDFDNGLTYIEQKANARVQDCFFAEKDQLWPDGSIKDEGVKYFYCSDPEDVEKNIKPINCLTFNGFDHLYFINDQGEIVKKTV